MGPAGESVDRCAGCHLAIAGGAAACQLLMDEQLARDFGDVMYFRVHRLFVDTYCLQHPERYCVSFKSLAAHVMHLCWSLELNGSRAVPSEALRRWVERHPRLPKPELPGFRGAMTIADVVKAHDAAAYARAVDSWARSTWEAYSALQSTTRHWIHLALEGRTNSTLIARNRRT